MALKAGEFCSAQTFYDLCARHDWYYTMSDDHRVWESGRQRSHQLEDLARTSPALATMLAAWRDHIFNNAEKPERPE